MEIQYPCQAVTFYREYSGASSQEAAANAEAVRGITSLLRHFPNYRVRIMDWYEGEESHPHFVLDFGNSGQNPISAPMGAHVTYSEDHFDEGVGNASLTQDIGCFKATLWLDYGSALSDPDDTRQLVKEIVDIYQKAMRRHLPEYVIYPIDFVDDDEIEDRWLKLKPLRFR